jgi:hypothetical protein
MNLTCLHPCGSQYPWLTYQGVPFYHTDRPSLVPSISDQHLALAAPVIAYWVWSLVFHCLDISGWQWLDRYRIHPSDEVQSRNRVTPAEVVRAVFVQHTLQTALGLLFLADEGSLPAVDHRKGLQDVARILEEMVRWLCSETRACATLNTNGSDAVYFIYWWAIPTFQFFFAMCVLLPSSIGLFSRSCIGFSLTPGNISFTAWYTRTNSCTNISIPSTTVYTCPMRLAHCTTIP